MRNITLSTTNVIPLQFHEKIYFIVNFIFLFLARDVFDKIVC